VAAGRINTASLMEAHRALSNVAAAAQSEATVLYLQAQHEGTVQSLARHHACMAMTGPGRSPFIWLIP
jgi:hypothetical protein